MFKNISISKKVLITIIATILVNIIVWFSNYTSIKELINTSANLDILGRQRLLTQAMSKTLFSYVISKNALETIKKQVIFENARMSAWRTQYTDQIMPVANKYNIHFGMYPSKNTLLYPASLTRQVNEFSTRRLNSISVFTLESKALYLTLISFQSIPLNLGS